MNTCPFPKTLIIAIVALTAMVGHGTMYSANPFLRLRANVGVTSDANGVRTWVDPISGVTATVGAGLPQPTSVGAAVNGRTALSFAGNAFLSVNTDQCFKGSYSIYVVLKHNGVVGSNNIVSGNAHAFWLASTTFPRLLHNGNFNQQAVSSVPLTNWCVLRATFDASTGRARIAVNNAEGVSTIIPQTNDATFLIGAYAASNFFNGEIAEVVYYHGVLPAADQLIEDNRLHAFYAIPRVPDPAPPSVAFSLAPKRLQILPIGDSIRVDGLVLDPSVLSVELAIDSQGVVIDQRTWTMATTGPNVTYNRGLPAPNLSQYRVVVTASRSGTRDTVLYADSITTGIVLAISGQSNSVFGDPLGTKAPLARTFGSNYSSSPGDTAWSLSNPTLYGGGSTVGAVGKYLQDHLISQNMPSAVINGGVGGTTIQQHLPNATFTEALSTIHGSWSYRRRIAKVNEFINYMFWYQGESNNGNDDYVGMFDSVYTQWHKEMPNLKHVMVIQVRPGCNGGNHAKLREQQRRLQQLYPDVMVIAAAGLPDHEGDNCHYGRLGYNALGAILSHHLDSGGFDGSRSLAPEWSSPNIVSATYANDLSTVVRLKFRGYQSSIPILQMPPVVTVAGVGRTKDLAFFADGDETKTPTLVDVLNDEVHLTFATPVTTVSYIPANFYKGTQTNYEGPWLVNAKGVGALTFHEFPVRFPLTGVEHDVLTHTSGTRRIVDVGEVVDLVGASDGNVRIVDLRGSVVHEVILSNGTGFVVPALAAAPYVVIAGVTRLIILVR